MTNRLDNEFRFHQSALGLRAERQQLLASNIANADTPNFKARDIDFRKAMQQALGGSPASVNGNRSAVMQPAGKFSGSGAELLYRTPRQDSIDGNTVELDAERAQFADNAVRYEASVSAVNGKIKSLLAAITGQ